MVYIIFDDHPNRTLIIFFVELQNLGPLKLRSLRKHSSTKVPSPLLYANAPYYLQPRGNSYPIAIYKIPKLSATTVVVQLEVLPTNKTLDRFFRKISFDPPMTVRYLPREVLIFRQLSCLRMPNGNGKP